MIVVYPRAVIFSWVFKQQMVSLMGGVNNDL
jgi:hypothetical protein